MATRTAGSVQGEVEHHTHLYTTDVNMAAAARALQLAVGQVVDGNIVHQQSVRMAQLSVESRATPCRAVGRCLFGDRRPRVRASVSRPPHHLCCSHAFVSTHCTLIISSSDTQTVGQVRSRARCHDVHVGHPGPPAHLERKKIPGQSGKAAPGFAEPAIRSIKCRLPCSWSSRETEKCLSHADSASGTQMSAKQRSELLCAKRSEEVTKGEKEVAISDNEEMRARTLAYFTSVSHAKHPPSEVGARTSREMRLLASAVDSLVKEELPQDADLLMQSFAALEPSVADTRWAVWRLGYSRGNATGCLSGVAPPRARGGKGRSCQQTAAVGMLACDTSPRPDRSAHPSR